MNHSKGTRSVSTTRQTAISTTDATYFAIFELLARAHAIFARVRVCARVPIDSNETPPTSQYASHDSVDLSYELATPFTTPEGPERRNNAPTSPDDPSTHPDVSSACSSHGISKQYATQSRRRWRTPGQIVWGWRGRSTLQIDVSWRSSRRRGSSRLGHRNQRLPNACGRRYRQYRTKRRRSDENERNNISRIVYASPEAQEALDSIENPHDDPGPPIRAPKASEPSPALQLPPVSPTSPVPAENASSCLRHRKRIYHVPNDAEQSKRAQESPERFFAAPSMRTYAPTVSDDRGELCLRHKLIGALRTAEGVGIAGTTRKNVDNAKPNLPGRLLSPARPLEATEPPESFEANPSIARARRSCGRRRATQH